MWIPPWLCTTLAAPPASVVSIDEPIIVDGALTESAWQSAPAVTDFLKFSPIEGGTPDGQTEVRFLQDDRALYIGIRITDTGYPIRARISARERINADDQVGIYLDTFLDGRSGYIFYLNALGIQQDIRHNSGNWNANWDTAFRSVGQVVDDGYAIEISIPWRSLKFPGTEGPQTWGLILTRKVPHLGAKYAYPDISLNKPLLFSEEGLLEGVDPPSRGSGLELIPTLTMSQQWAPDPDTSAPPDLGRLDLDPWYDALRPSLDLRFGLTPDLGLAATVNPDFSQVEGDFADVRLNARFAFQFTERRPFFLDGIDFFDDGADTLYSRSIAQPLYGLKLSGREGPVSVGILHALDRSPLASIHEAGAPGFDAEDVEGRSASNTLARAKVDAFDGGWVGWTAADKRLVGAGAGAGAGAHDSVAIDVGIPFADRWLAQAATQSSWTGDGVDPLTWGLGQSLDIVRSTGVGTGAGIRTNASTNDYRQEMGFLPQSGLFTATTFLNHTFLPPGALETYRPEVYGYVFEESDADHFRMVGNSHYFLLRGIHWLWLDAKVHHRLQSDAALTGYDLVASGFAQIGSILEINPAVALSRSLDFGTLGPAQTLDIGTVATLRSGGFRVDTEVGWSRHVPEGLDPEIAHLVRTSLIGQFTRSLGARLLVQESRRAQAEGIDQSLLISPLITWLDVPGTAVHLGWTERIDLTGGATTERVVFLKLSALIRP